jgi:phosphate transport system substrate-binding protein
MLKTARLVMVPLLSSVLIAAVAWGEVIKVGAGAGAPTENVLKPVKDSFEKASGIQLAIVSAGVKSAMQDVEAGTIDAGAAGFSFEDWLNFMKKEGAEVTNPSIFTPVVIGKDRIKVFINKENPVARLSKEQLQKIFSGEIESWKDVGGPDTPILIAWGQLQQGTNSTFTKQIMDGKPVAKEILAVSSANDVRTTVVANASAIGFGPGGVVNDTVKVVEAPEISRDITLITKGKPSAKVQKLIDYILGDGKKFVK